MAPVGWGLNRRRVYQNVPSLENRGGCSEVGIVGVEVEVERRRQAGVVADYFCVVRRIQAILRGVEVVPDIGANRTRPAFERQSVAGINCAGRSDADDAVVELVADQRVPAAKSDG